MARIHSPLQEVDAIGKLADLKEQHYHNTLMLQAVIQLLEDKSLVTAKEVEARAQELDRFTRSLNRPIT